jgi:hypothetical protein
LAPRIGGKLGSFARSVKPAKIHFQKFYTAKAGQTDLGCGIFPGLRKGRDELIYGGPEKFNQSQGGRFRP